MVVDFIEVNTLAKTREDLSKSYVAIVLACLSDPVESQNMRISYMMCGILKTRRLLTSWRKVSPGDHRFRTAIGHADQGYIAALIHSDIRRDVGDLWWNCKDKSKWNM